MMNAFISRIERFLQKVHGPLTRDLTWNDLNKSFNGDMRGVYEYYARNMKSFDGIPRGPKRTIKFIWLLFIAFLMKLTPPRRLMYAIALFFIFVAVSQEKTASAIYSFVIVSILLAMELADKLITKDELSVARDIQLSLQPTGMTVIPGYDFVAYSEAAKQVGGDYYDILTLSDDSSLIVIGDVSGKGISSALYVVKIQTALQLFASETCNLKELLIRLNSHVYGQLKRNYFFSLFLVKLYSDGKIELCRAGHPPALLLSAMDKNISWLKPNGMAVGMAASEKDNEPPDQKKNMSFRSSLETRDLRVQQGDVLFLFTDGVSESANVHGKEYGQEKIAELIKSFSHEPVEKIRDHLVDDLKVFREGTDLRDDTTFILLKRSS
jgi:phosphoserine phosphatase RsbU/P